MRAVFCLNETDNTNVKSVDIAKYLGVSKPAVSEMLKKLKKQKLIIMSPYSKISLSLKGFKEARKLTYKHRVIELFLKEVLHYDENQLHQEAHKLEHAVSDELAVKISALLNKPQYCPCGHKIPNIN